LAAAEKARAEAEARVLAEKKARAEVEARARSGADARVQAEMKARTEAESRAEAADQARTEAESRAEATERARAEAESRIEAAEKARARVEARVGKAEQERAESLHQAEELERARVAAETRAFTAERLRVELEARVERAEKALAASRAQSEELAARARTAILSIQVPGRSEVDIPRGGSLNQEGLARLVTRLQEARAQVRLELKVANALRILWLKDGAVVGAVSSAADESLVDRARADGLIDARQENELRLVRGSSTGALIEAMRGRGYVRENEVVPLVQRYTEQVALDALGESSSLYRLTEEPPPHEVALAASTRPLLHLLAESLRNGVPTDSFVEAAGGLRAVVVRGEPEPSPESFGLSSRELRLLSEVDGEQTLEQLLLGAGMPQDSALKVLAVARALGLITLRPAAGLSGSEQVTAGELDVRRLESKFEEIQDADYFTVLGLSRAAGSEEVKRAYALLTAEFHPLRFAGHPDAALQHRAQQFSSARAEAARALADDRLREEYARSLLD
ncbi:MAG: DnaJ domain-containing protein, partial [Archangium sp.]